VVDRFEWSSKGRDPGGTFHREIDDVAPHLPDGPADHGRVEKGLRFCEQNLRGEIGEAGDVRIRDESGVGLCGDNSVIPW
jgi:hypothetical protein